MRFPVVHTDFIKRGTEFCKGDHTHFRCGAGEGKEGFRLSTKIALSGGQNFARMTTLVIIMLLGKGKKSFRLCLV